MPRKLFELKINCGRMGIIHSLFVGEEAIVKFVEEQQGLYFDEVLGKHSEIIREAGTFFFEEHDDADPKVIAFIEDHPIGPAPNAIEQAIVQAIDHAQEDPLTCTEDEYFLEMLDAGGGSDYGYATREEFYKDCLNEASQCPDQWTDEETFWKEIQTRYPARFKEFVRLCRDKNVRFMVDSNVDTDSDSEPTKDTSDSIGPVKKKVGEIESDEKNDKGSCKRICT